MIILTSGCAPYQALKRAHYITDVPVSEPVVVDKNETSVNRAESFNLNVPFYSQAPTGDWGMPYQEACEEASLLLAWYYVTNQAPSMKKFEEDLLAMVEWEIDYFGQYEHTTAEQTAEMAQLYLQHPNVEVVTNPSENQIRDWLIQGYPVVAPFAGRYLGNPYFTGEGPVYHMLVIRGYDGSRFITNDVGTRHGENFTYKDDVLMNALHDWDDSASVHDEGILNGARSVVVVKP